MSKAVLKPKSIGLHNSKLDEIVSLLELIRNATEEQGGMSVIAKKAGLSREALYRALSPSGNPTIKTLTLVLGALGMVLSVTQVRQESADDAIK